jgi:anti-sigma factor RsiW
MNPGPDHEAVQEMLAAAALGMLEHAELQRVLAHTGDCPECAHLLQEYRDAAAQLALMLPPERLDPARSARVKARLLARVQAEKGRGAIYAWRADRWVGWLVAAGLAGVLLVHHSVHRTLDYGWLAAGVLAIILVGVIVYAGIQKRRATALREIKEKRSKR